METIIEFGPEVCADLTAALQREWLETNGLGGFASSTIPGLNTRRYHGLLVAATQPPTGRMVLLSNLEETLFVDGRQFDLSANRYPGTIHPQGYRYLRGFRLAPYPVATYACGSIELERHLCMLQGENSTTLRYVARVPEGMIPQSLWLELRPLLAFRDYHALARENPALDPHFTSSATCIALRPYAGCPTLYLAHDAREVETAGWWYRDFEYERERERGLDFREDLFNPLVLRFDLSGDGEARLVASTEPRDAARVAELQGVEARRREGLVAAAPSHRPLIRRLTLAADQFIVRRDDRHTIIAGYPWFTDWGRDTMIALPGLALVTGRPECARSILLEFRRYVDRGMLPNRFPDTGKEPEYNTVDATLWYFEAIRAYLRRTSDLELVREHLYPALVEIIDWHVRGTRYGIHVDADGLVAAGAEGVQLTWMDAKVGDWVVTPRRGKPVEIQALWYNALRVTEELAGHFGDAETKQRCARIAARARRSFNRLFWNEEADCLYDVVEGDRRDGSIRPNQLLALSLGHSMVGRDRALRVLGTVQRELLTPRGLRTLSPRDPRYVGRCEGDVWTRDGAYHQGTAWPWLLGPFLTAYVRTHRGSRKARAQAEEWLRGMEDHFREAGVGQVSEIFDGDPPHHPRGCIAQAWSVAELLRAAMEDVFP